jgi:hypothetical protein
MQCKRHARPDVSFYTNILIQYRGNDVSMITSSNAAESTTYIQVTLLAQNEIRVAPCITRGFANRSTRKRPKSSPITGRFHARPRKCTRELWRDLPRHDAGGLSMSSWEPHRDCPDRRQQVGTGQRKASKQPEK